MRTVLGVDSSTQSTKVEARALESGSVLAVGRAPHPPTRPPVSEQDPEAWWRALVQAIRSMPEDVRAGVVAISVAGQQHGLVLLDEQRRPVRSAKLWNDTTAFDAAQRIVADLGAGEWAARCGSVPVSSFTVAKLAWAAEHEPDTIERAAYVGLPHDFVTLRLTDSWVTDRGDASGTGWFDPTAGDYRADLLEAGGLVALWAYAGLNLLTFSWFAFVDGFLDHVVKALGLQNTTFLPGGDAETVPTVFHLWSTHAGDLFYEGTGILTFALGLVAMGLTAAFVRTALSPGVEREVQRRPGA